eukprot:scaffold1123_cov168-Amphora_coffeaeformis.AAC.3
MYLPSQSPYVVTDDDEESSSSSSSSSAGVVLLHSLRAAKQGPPPLHMALIKPALPKAHKARPSRKMPRDCRPLPPAPRLAKHLERRASPICLKLSR